MCGAAKRHTYWLVLLGGNYLTFLRLSGGENNTYPLYSLLTLNELIHV